MMFNRIVLITDEMKTFTSADLSRRDLEGNSAKSSQLIKEELLKISNEVIHYTDISLFSANINQHKSDIIFPMRYGNNSTSSKSFIPAICESNQLIYVGADCYAHSLCNDKYLSKLYAQEFGIKSSKSVLIRQFEEERVYKQLQNLKLPLVVKPNFGGGSTGISVQNIAKSYQEAIQLASSLILFHEMPILIEEYIQGHEVEYIIFGSKQNIILEEEVKLIMNNLDYFENEIWGFETKKLDDSSIDFSKSCLLSDSDKENLKALFQSFDKVEFMRIDGRFQDGEFFLIELSPDCYLGEDCAFYYAFKQKGFEFDQMFKLLIQNAQAPC